MCLVMKFSRFRHTSAAQAVQTKLPETILTPVECFSRCFPCYKASPMLWMTPWWLCAKVFVTAGAAVVAGAGGLRLGKDYGLPPCSKKKQHKLEKRQAHFHWIKRCSIFPALPTMLPSPTPVVWTSFPLYAFHPPWPAPTTSDAVTKCGASSS